MTQSGKRRSRWLGPRARGFLRGIGRFVSIGERHPRKLFCLLLACAFLANLFDSFGLDDAGDRAWAEVIDSVGGPLYGKWHWNADDRRIGQKSIVVVLIQDSTLEEYEQDGLPLSYQAQADILGKVASAQPRAIFWDLYYPRARVVSQAIADFGGLTAQRSAIPATGAPPPIDAGVAHLAATMGGIGQHIPLLIGPVAGADVPARQDAQRTPLAPLIDLVRRDQGSELSRGVHQVWLDVDNRHVREYLSGQPQPGKSKAAAEQTGELHSAAVALYEAYCTTSPARARPCPQAPLAGIDSPFLVQWGLGVSQWRSELLPEEYRPRCGGGANGVGSFLDYVKRGLFRGIHRSPEDVPESGNVAASVEAGADADDLSAGVLCGYHDIIPASALGGRDARGVPMMQHLKGKIVLIGIDIAMSGDRRTVPFYGNVAGVLTHAMAIDNLIETGGRPAAKPRRVWLGLDELDMLHYGGMIIMILALFLSREQVRRLFLSKETLESRSSLILGCCVAVLSMIALIAIFYAILRHWSLPAILFSGMLPGGIFAICLLFFTGVTTDLGRG